MDSPVSARLGDLVSHTVAIGAGQGIARLGECLYVYGDMGGGQPGLITELTLDCRPTGRTVRLSRDGEALVTHPTGLTWHTTHGCVLGNTVSRHGTLFWLDWQVALRDGALDAAVLAVVDDDAAGNGCRPEFVTLDGRAFLATADYGDANPAIRLLDPLLLRRAERTSDHCVVAVTLPASPYIQTLAWDLERGLLACLRNVTAGRGWCVELLDLAAAVAAGTTLDPSVLRGRHVFAEQTELEGGLRLHDETWVLVTSAARENLAVGALEPL